MSLASVFNIAGTGMSAQSTRLNTISSNIANAETVSSSIDQTYRARHPVFATVFDSTMQGDRGSLFADQDQAGHVFRLVAQENHRQHEHQPRPDDPVLHQRQQQHAPVGVDQRDGGNQQDLHDR